MPTFVAAWSSLKADRHRSELYRLWRSAAAAGFTVPAAMEMMGVRQSAESEAARRWLLDGTRKGKGVGDVVRRGGARFGEFERALLLLGDESGTLEQSLRLLADFHAARDRAMRQVIGRITYPLFTGLLATFIAPVPLLVSGRGTLYLFVVTLGLSAWMVLGGSIVLGAARRYGRQSALVRARFARALATAIEAGLPLPRAVRLAGAAADDDALRRFVDAIGERALTERSLVETLARCPHMSPDFLAMLGTAERTGDYRTTIARLAALYEDGFR